MTVIALTCGWFSAVLLSDPCSQGMDHLESIVMLLIRGPVFSSKDLQCSQHYGSYYLEYKYKYKYSLSLDGAGYTN